MAEHDVLGELVEYHKLDEVAEVGAVQEHRALLPVAADWVEAGHSGQQAASMVDRSPAAARLQEAS